MNYVKRLWLKCVFSIPLCLFSSIAAQAQIVPGPADIGRIKPEEKQLVAPKKSEGVSTSTTLPLTAIPEAAEKVRFELKDLEIKGVTAFNKDQLADIYAPYLNKEIGLDVVYKIAGQITQHYRDAGYFLSLAYVPDQSIEQGIVIINVIEGYIGQVEIDRDIVSYSVIQKYIQRLTAVKPLTSDALESFLLRMNDIPGYSFNGVLSPIEQEEEGSVKLALVANKKTGTGNLSFDNFSSRFLGPNEVVAAYAASLLPLQQTTVSGLTSLPTDKLNYATLGHFFLLAPDITLEVLGSITKAKPGFTLERFEVKSNSTFLSAGINYQWFRQRQSNLVLKLSFDSRNTNSDLLFTPFTRDRIRAIRASANYDLVDSWMGANNVNLKFSQGVDILGSSEKGDRNLSRAQAAPDFTKVELSLARLQTITDDWSVLITGSAQYANGPLFSAEEFGYGGQGFGRAYDASEITGDHGFAGGLELRYSGWNYDDVLRISPFVFYDIGVVWNHDIAQTPRESGASAGFGLRGYSSTNLNGTVGLAWPLTRDIGTPIYGQNNSNPRILLQLSKSF